MAWIRTRDDQRVHVRIVGRGQPCVLLHGFASESLGWLPYVAPLLRETKFIMPDLRGWGPSGHVPLRDGCVLTNYAEDLEDVLEILKLDQVPIAAISMGALTTLQSYELFGGRRFSRFLHIEQGPKVQNDEHYEHGLLGDYQQTYFTRLRANIDALEAHSAELPYDALPLGLRMEFWTLFAQFASAGFARRWISRLAYAMASTEPVARRLLPVASFRTHLRVIRAYLDGNYDLRTAFRHIRVPLTVLIGGASRMYPPAGQWAIAKLAPHASVREIPGVGHNVPLEAPVQFVRELRAFTRGSAVPA
jgi:pimeloyl-ACP methyl ester carboxylesterase